jgi:hypothetical protein
MKKRHEYSIYFHVPEYVIEALEKAAEIASTQKGKEYTTDDVAKGIIMSIIGKYGEKLIY